MDVAAARAFDRRLFLAVAVGFPLLVLIGFAPTYYAKGWFGTPPLPSALVHTHGLLMTTWVALFIVQVRLVSTRRIRLHQTLGYASIGLAAAIVLTGIPVALRAGKYGSAASPPDIPALAFMVVPVFDLLLFALLFGAAVYYRKRPAAHKALMLVLALSLLPPALGRMPIAPLQALGPLWFFGVPTGAAITALVLDARQRGQVNRVLLGATLLLAGSYVVRLAIMNTTAWTAFATWATSFV